ncbi:hypothetical protein HaLaN_27772 [Haematococcus lacustris]|uniref:Uncharacterized protein n=1 Tax=Haematococcus lacustris TaxID=44745 RepID=A0A6A0AB95_HAELA|nr:hypothetical protein HaLaN_27772 [Haematococcus lacustris]
MHEATTVAGACGSQTQQNSFNKEQHVGLILGRTLDDYQPHVDGTFPGQTTGLLIKTNSLDLQPRPQRSHQRRQLTVRRRGDSLQCGGDSLQSP